MSKKEEIEKLREEVELEELRLKREKQKTAQRTRSVAKYSLITFLVIGLLISSYLIFGEPGISVVVIAMLVFGLIGLFGYTLSKDKERAEKLSKMEWQQLNIAEDQDELKEDKK